MLQHLDMQKKILTYHGNFSSSDLFREMDKDNNGYLTLDEFQNYFSEDEMLETIDYGGIISQWDSNGDGKLTYSEFQKGLNAYGVSSYQAATASEYRSP